MRAPHTLVLVSLASAIALASFACGGDDSDFCSITALENQPRDRFVAGGTFYLSAPAAVDGCTPVSWTVTNAPDNSVAFPVEGADGFVRFTPVVPGDYTLSADDGTSEQVTVVATDEAPFHNLNYYGSTTQAFVGDELWVANVSARSVSRLAVSDLANRGDITVGPWPVCARALGAHQRSRCSATRQRHTWIHLRTERVARRLCLGWRRAVECRREPPTARPHTSPSPPMARLRLSTSKHASSPQRSWVSTTPSRWLSPRTAPPSTSPDIAPRKQIGSPSTTRPLDEERDVAVIDTTSLTVTDYWLEVGTTINGLAVSADGTTVYVATTQGDPERNFADGDAFTHEIAVYDSLSGSRTGARGPRPARELRRVHGLPVWTGGHRRRAMGCF